MTACNITVSMCEQKPSMFDVSREMGSSVALYSRKVLIQTKATEILPKWLRFLRGQSLLSTSSAVPILTSPFIFPLTSALWCVSLSVFLDPVLIVNASVTI